MTDDDVGPRRREIPPTRRGFEFDIANSALQKCIRRGDEQGAVFFAIELHESGFHDHVWRRLRLICSEDCGVAWPMGPVVVHALHESWANARKHRRAGGLMFVVHAALALARAPKSRIVPHALIALADGPALPVPDAAVDQHTRRGRQLGRGYEHFFDEAALLADPETGELTAEGSLPDAYLEQARQATGRRKLGQPRAPSTAGSLPEPEQMTIDEEIEP